MEKTMDKKVLLHVCCGCCAGSVIEKLKNEGYEIVAFFYNPNIYPKEEYLKRKEAAMKIISIFNINHFEGFLDELYNEENEKWIFKMKELNLENEPESGKRCEKCFEIRLKETAKAAQLLGINNFATTLTVSPHKNAEIINRIGNDIANKFDIAFVAEDFKKNNGFKKTMEIAKSHGIYRQNYCGCKFPLRV